MDKLSRIEELKKRRSDLYHSLLLSSHTFKRARKLIISLEERYLKDRKAWQECDYELALLDGRRQIVEPKVRKTRAVQDIDISQLTDGQLMEIAEKLGLHIDPEAEE